MSDCRHYWTEADNDRWACTDCDETCASCIECRKWTDSSLLICQRCVNRIRRLIDDIETAVALHAADTSRNTPTTRRSSHDTQVS